ncbi:MAG: undecaprenyl-diphosphate phosphatase [Myxococcota bacterium]
MSTLEALLLGVIQGLTEFLPVSSSGHLMIGQHLLGMSEPQLLFDIILHVGTLLAVVAFYRADVLEVVRGMYRGITDGLSERSLDAATAPEGMRLSLLVLLTMLPTGVLGVFLDKLLDPDTGPRLITVQVVCVLLIVNGVILFANRFMRNKEPAENEGRFTLWNITPAMALMIGVVQGMAVAPGFSRSGFTITLALFLGVWRTDAARFSFLMSIPAILGALVFKFEPGVFTSGAIQTIPLVVGALVSAAVGYLAILLLVNLLEKAQFFHFSWYCWALGITGLLLL